MNGIVSVIENHFEMRLVSSNKVFVWEFGDQETMILRSWMHRATEGLRGYEETL